MGLHRRRRPRLGDPFLTDDHTRHDVELPTELGRRLLARHRPLNRCELEFGPVLSPAICLPPMLAQGSPADLASSR
jgi:hypothetical protein